MLRSLLLTACLWMAGPTLACDASSLPLRYLRVIEAMDWATMQGLLAPDAAYRDPTMVYFDRPAIDLSGPQDIVEFWRSASEDSSTSSIRYEIEDCFETASYFVINYRITIGVGGEFWNVNLETIEVPGRVTSIIRTEDGQIREHIDYVDYAGSEAWIDQLREEVGPAQ